MSIIYPKHFKLQKFEFWFFRYRGKIYDFSIDRTGVSFDIGRYSFGVGWGL